MTTKLPVKIFRLDLRNTDGNPFRVLYIPVGTQNPNYPAATEVKKDIVEFYDLEYPHTPDGQFTGGRYYLSTLLEGGQSHGLNFYGDEPKWQLSAVDMSLVWTWLRHIGGVPQ